MHLTPVLLQWENSCRPVTLKSLGTVLPRLHSVALTVLGVPATSAPVERVFSRGGIFMRPHRSRLSNKSLSNLVFLKCNLDKLH